ncbi:NUDIX hydrolase, partial [Candidatus Amesbacteria bacterium]|nr:NUDIX hydrolase [Candidatus Amesbacteria bacterium]
MSTERRERLPVSVSAAVFIENHEGRLLLLQQAAERKGYKWGPPAGGMEAHEDPIETAHRETREEIGVEVEILNLLGIYTVDRGETATGIAFVFRGRIVSGEIRLRPGEIDTYRYFTKDEV